MGILSNEIQSFWCEVKGEVDNKKLCCNLFFKLSPTQKMILATRKATLNC